MRHEKMRLGVLALAVAAGVFGCGVQKTALRAELTPLGLRRGPVAVLEDNLFRRDGSGSISEQDLKRVLAAPVFLKQGARLGVVQVSQGYRVDGQVPLTAVPAELSQALEGSGIFDVATEVSADWPTDSGVPGLRELAARYRLEYLLLYRHRFVDRSWTNPWGWAYLTIVGALFVPSQSLETAGVLEATLFDVRTGTILFTTFERVRSTIISNVWYTDLKRQALQERLLAQAAGRLADKVVTQARRLAARRPQPVQAPVVAERG